MMQSLYIGDNGNTEFRNGGLVFILPQSFTSNSPYNRNVRLIEIGKSMDHFNYSNPISVQKLKDKIDSIFDFNQDLKFVLNFAGEESIVDDTIFEFYKELLHNKKILLLTNNAKFLGRDNHIFYNCNTWIMEDLSPHFIDSLNRIKQCDLGTIKKKFMFLNNHFSKIRFDILKMIYKNNKQSEGNISFNLIDLTKLPFDGLETEEQFKKECEEYSIQYPSYYDTYPTLTQIGDEERERKKILGINHIGTVEVNYRIYLESFFEIVTETGHLLKVDKGVFVSEKIHKNLKTGSPFIYHGKKELKECLERVGFSFKSPMYFFGEGEEYMNYLSDILNKDIEWYNDIQRTYLDEYYRNSMRYMSFQINQSNNIVKFLYK